MKLQCALHEAPSPKALTLSQQRFFFDHGHKAKLHDASAAGTWWTKSRSLEVIARSLQENLVAVREVQHRFSSASKHE